MPWKKKPISLQINACCDGVKNRHLNTLLLIHSKCFRTKSKSLLHFTFDTCKNVISSSVSQKHLILEIKLKVVPIQTGRSTMSMTRNVNFLRYERRHKHNLLNIGQTLFEIQIAPLQIVRFWIDDSKRWRHRFSSGVREFDYRTWNNPYENFGQFFEFARLLASNHV